MSATSHAYDVLLRHFGSSDADLLAEAFDQWLCRLEARCVRIAGHGTWVADEPIEGSQYPEIPWEPVAVSCREHLRELLVRHFGEADAAVLTAAYTRWMAEFEQECFLASRFQLVNPRIALTDKLTRRALPGPACEERSTGLDSRIGPE